MAKITFTNKFSFGEDKTNFVLEIKSMSQNFQQIT